MYKVRFFLDGVETSVYNTDNFSLIVRAITFFQRFLKARFSFIIDTKLKEIDK